MIQLELEDYQVTPMESAVLALDFLKESKGQSHYPDLVITDVKMDEMDGEKFVRVLEEKYPDLEVLVISAYEQPDSLKDYPFLKKPFRFDVMNEIICRNSEKSIPSRRN